MTFTHDFMNVVLGQMYLIGIIWIGMIFILTPMCAYVFIVLCSPAISMTFTGVYVTVNIKTISNKIVVFF